MGLSSPVPMVSVVIPTRDRPDMVRVAALANLAQVGIQLEVLVVDDGSNIDIGAALADIGDDRLRVIRLDESVGVSGARNAGLAVAAGTWVAFCDDDDIPAPGKLQAQLRALAEHPSAVWSCVGAVKIDEELRIIGAQPTSCDGDVTAVLLSHNIVPGGGSGVLARTDVVRALGGFDPDLSMHADYDLWIRLSTAGDLAAVPQPLLGYRLHATAMSQLISSTASELARVDAKHERLRSSLGVTWHEGYYRIWHAERQQRAGHRFVAARSYLAASGHIGVCRAVLRAGEALVIPGAHVWRETRRLRRFDQAWLGQAEAWLTPLRAAPTEAARPAGRVAPVVGEPRSGSVIVG